MQTIMQLLPMSDRYRGIITEMWSKDNRF